MRGTFEEASLIVLSRFLCDDDENKFQDLKKKKSDVGRVQYYDKYLSPQQV